MTKKKIHNKKFVDISQVTDDTPNVILPFNQTNRKKNKTFQEKNLNFLASSLFVYLKTCRKT